jgi:aminopeptidase N
VAPGWSYDVHLVRAQVSRFLPILVAFSLALAAPAHAGGAREPFFPRAGNRGYDVSHYFVSLAYRPAGGRIQARARIEAVASAPLRRFALDLFGLHATRVTVSGEAARFGRGRGKLKVVPAEPLVAGRRFGLVVDYRGRPRKVVDPDGSREGWYRTDDGAFAVGEPIGTAAWIPCNDVPADKATFGFRITVPPGLKAVANGRLLGVERRGARTSFEWGGSGAMSPYLAVLDVGRGRLVRGEAAGVPAWTLVDPRLLRGSRRVLSRLPEVIRFESRLLGPYPFGAAGSIVDFAPELGYALETQTRPIYPYRPDLTTLVHETAHQWFGDSVGLERWPEIWLNEGFATWSEWYYAERHGGRSARTTFRRLYRVPAADTKFWNPPPARPGTAKNLFASSTYVRGAMALEALRLAIGTRPMLRLLRAWATRHRHGSADIREFVALAEEVSGRDLDRLFQRWLFRRGKPVG